MNYLIILFIIIKGILNNLDYFNNYIIKILIYIKYNINKIYKYLNIKIFKSLNIIKI